MTPPRVGEVYADKMFRTDMEVIAVGDRGITIRDRGLPDGRGNWYSNEQWDKDVESSRFVRVDHLLAPYEGPVAIEEPTDPETTAAPETAGDGDDPSPRDALSW